MLFFRESELQVQGSLSENRECFSACLLLHATRYVDAEIGERSKA